MRTCCVLALLCYAASAGAQASARTTTKAYYVRDFISVPKDRPLPGSPYFKQPDDAETNSLAQLADLLTKVVAPHSWSGHSGAGGIAVVGDVLIVHNTEDVQHEIAATLQTLRTASGNRVRLTAYWLFVSRKDYHQHASAADADRKREILNEWIKSAPSQSGEVLAFNNQTVHLLSGTRRMTVAQVTTVMAEDAKGFDPAFHFRNDGLAVQLTPTIGSEGETVTVEVHAYLTESNDQRPATVVPPTVMMIPAITRNIVHTTVQLVPDQPLLVAALNRNPRLGSKDAPIACLVLQAGLLESAKPPAPAPQP